MEAFGTVLAITVIAALGLFSFGFGEWVLGRIADWAERRSKHKGPIADQKRPFVEKRKG